MEMAGVWVCLAVSWLLLPFAALVLALIARSKAADLKKDLERLRGEVSTLRRSLDALVQARGATPPPPPPAGVPLHATEAPRAVPAAEAVATSLASTPAASPPPPDAAAAPVPPAPPPEAPAFPAAPPPIPSEASPEGRPVPPPPPASPPPPPSIPAATSGGWERRLGILVPVWVGAIALALGGGYLVQYSIERGLLGPEVRVALGVVLGMALLAAGEGLRRRYPITGQGASAAGIAALYAAFLAATVLYSPPLLDPWVGFSLIIMTTAVGIALSLRQGVVVAVIGLLGGFFTPYWIGVASASPGRFFSYLLLLQGGLLAVSGKRRWPGLSAMTLLLGLGAALHRLGSPSVEADAIWIGLFLLLGCASFWAAGALARPGDATPLGSAPKVLGALSVGGSLAILATLTARTHFGPGEWAFLGILAAGTLVLGRLDRAYALLPWASFCVTTLLLYGWASSPPPDKQHLRLIVVLFGILWAVGGWVAHLGAPEPARWAALSALGGLAMFGAGYAADLNAVSPFQHWGWLAFGLAALYLPASFHAAAEGRRSRLGDGPLGAYAIAVTAFLSLAVALELERAWIAVAWTVEAAAAAWLLERLRLKALGLLALALFAGAAVRLLLNPFVLEYPAGSLPVLNWILYGYGVPIAALALAVPRFRQAGWDIAASALTCLACAFAFALVTLQVRQGFHLGGTTRGGAGIAEVATYSHLWLLLAIGLLAASRAGERRELFGCGVAIVGLSAFKLLASELLVSPLVRHEAVGALPVLNLLPYAYGVPVLLLAALARVPGPPVWSRIARLLASLGGIILGLAWVTLEVRHLFQGTFLDGSAPTTQEGYAYSAAWILFALALLSAGILTGGRLARGASLVVMLLAVGKVFLYDLRHLQDLYRVGSLLGLGASLLLISFLYQRFVFRDARNG